MQRSNDESNAANSTVRHGHVDDLPEASALPVSEGSQDAERTHKAASGEISDEIVRPRGHGMGWAECREETRHCDIVDVVACSGCHWPILAVPSDASDDWGRERERERGHGQLCAGARNESDERNDKGQLYRGGNIPNRLLCACMTVGPSPSRSRTPGLYGSSKTSAF